MEKRIYRPLEAVSAEEVQRILASGTEEERGLLSLQVGEHGRQWAQSQAVCLKLMDDESPAVRANAALGLSYIARTQGQLDERLVKPYLLRELRENDTYRWRIIDAIKDINLFLDWHLAEKALSKYEEP